MLALFARAPSTRGVRASRHAHTRRRGSASPHGRGSGWWVGTWTMRGRCRSTRGHSSNNFGNGRVRATLGPRGTNGGLRGQLCSHSLQHSCTLHPRSNPAHHALTCTLHRRDSHPCCHAHSFVAALISSAHQSSSPGIATLGAGGVAFFPSFGLLLFGAAGEDEDEAWPTAATHFGRSTSEAEKPHRRKTSSSK